MVAKPSPTTVQTLPARKRKSAPVPAGMGLTPLMRDRQVYRREPLIGDEDTVTLFPVSAPVFMAEVKVMKDAGYVSEPDGPGLCEVCKSRGAVGVTYWRRHRNGKKDIDSQRGFCFCFDCLMVTESMLVDSDDPIGR